jgi:ribonuclease HII
MIYPPFEWKQLRPQPVIGVDEVGRGCLAGPVYAAACILKSEAHLNQLTDSKLISETRREILAPLILRDHRASIASASVAEIDELNILWAALLAMKRAVEVLATEEGLVEATVLVDGNFKIPDLSPRFKQIPVVKGDLRASPISAASIVAKVARDQRMKELGKEVPGYGFEKHKGYPSPFHKKAIADRGPTQWHRRSFAGVKEYI